MEQRARQDFTFRNVLLALCYYNLFFPAAFAFAHRFFAASLIRFRAAAERRRVPPLRLVVDDDRSLPFVVDTP